VTSDADVRRLVRYVEWKEWAIKDSDTGEDRQ